MRKLPSLNGIKAFEAAARHTSFVKAADELGVSAAAISRMVHLLEARLGVALFERRANRLELTAAGLAYKAGLSPLLDAIASLTAQVAAAPRQRVLTVGVGPTFAVRWLIPRLAEFRKEAPETEVRFATGGVAAPFADDWTCGIALGDGSWPDLVAEPLFAADIVPVCTPQLARRLQAPGDLDGATLIRVAHAPEDWPLWLEAAGTPHITARGPLLQYYGQALQAAADGVGIAMGIRPYIDDDLASGRLVTPFARTVPKGKHWYLVYRGSIAGRGELQTFRRWLLRAAGPELKLGVVTSPAGEEGPAPRPHLNP